MQTFLPYADFSKSAAVLDRQRLGKQRVENLQLMKALLVPGAGWSRHPAALMWKGHESWLFNYHTAICQEWIVVRGYKDTCLEKMGVLIEENSELFNVSAAPPWLGSKPFHRSHRSNLVRKDPDHYREFFPHVPDDLEYVWPLGKGAQ